MQYTQFTTESDKKTPILNIRPELKKKLGIGSLIVLGVLVALVIFGFFVVVKPAYSVMAVINDIKTNNTNMQKALIDRDIEKFNTLLDKTSKDLDRLIQVRNDSYGWAKAFPMTKEYYGDFDHFVAAGKHAVNAGKQFGVLIVPFADATGFKTAKFNENSSGLAEAFSGWIGIMPQVAENMDGIITDIAAIGDEMKKVKAGKYPEYIMGQPVRSLIISAQGALSQADDYGPDIKKALQILPGLLGVGGTEKRYAIIMQNDKEIRATGGFWTNYATFKLNNAMLTSDFSSKDMYSIDFILNAIDAWTTFPKVPPMYQKYLKVERMFARDANISPDFPTAIDQWMYFYKLAQQTAPFEVKPVDGIVAIDTQVISELLAVTGPVTVNGITFSEENVVLELEKIASLSLAEQSNRKKVLGDLMEGMLQNVFDSNNNLWPKLVDKGFDLMRRKHITAYYFDPEAQALLEKYNLAGRIVDPIEGDYAFVTQTNLGGGKSNLFVTKEVTHTLTKQNNKWLHQLDLKYSYPVPGEKYNGLVTPAQDWIRLYVPKGSEFVSLDGSLDPNETAEERNKTMFSGFIRVAPGEEKTMTFKYYLPDSAVKNGTYNLYIQKQSGIDSEIHNVVVNGKKTTYKVDADKKVSVKL
ncbi:DUF4012 domain-containing protein [candidate division WWE3 bacterium]|nr:DUF4012 domain-containing protein [candidate division WWE3 bacterium]